MDPRPTTVSDRRRSADADRELTRGGSVYTTTGRRDFSTVGILTLLLRRGERLDVSDRRRPLPSPPRTVGAAVVVIVACAFLYPLLGGVQDPASGTEVGVTVASPADAPRYYLTTVLPESLCFSVSTFAWGASDLRPVGAARWLATLEALLGMGLFALLVASLARPADAGLGGGNG